MAQHQRELTDRKRMRSVGSVRFRAIVLSNSGGRSDMTPICQVWSEIAATREREILIDQDLIIALVYLRTGYMDIY